MSDLFPVAHASSQGEKAPDARPESGMDDWLCVGSTYVPPPAPAAEPGSRAESAARARKRSTPSTSRGALSDSSSDSESPSDNQRSSNSAKRGRQRGKSSPEKREPSRDRPAASQRAPPGMDKVLRIDTHPDRDNAVYGALPRRDVPRHSRLRNAEALAPAGGYFPLPRRRGRRTTAAVPRYCDAAVRGVLMDPSAKRKRVRAVPERGTRASPAEAAGAALLPLPSLSANDVAVGLGLPQDSDEALALTATLSGPVAGGGCGPSASSHDQMRLLRAAAFAAEQEASRASTAPQPQGESEAGSGVDLGGSVRDAEGELWTSDALAAIERSRTAFRRATSRRADELAWIAVARNEEREAVGRRDRRGRVPRLQRTAAVAAKAVALVPCSARLHLMHARALALAGDAEEAADARTSAQTVLHRALRDAAAGNTGAHAAPLPWVGDAFAACLTDAAACAASRSFAEHSAAATRRAYQPSLTAAADAARGVWEAQHAGAGPGMAPSPAGARALAAAEAARLDVLTQWAAEERASGRHDVAVAGLQAAWEMAADASPAVAEKPWPVRMKFFEAFWEAQAPRIGDSGGPLAAADTGWSRWLTSEQARRKGTPLPRPRTECAPQPATAPFFAALERAAESALDAAPSAAPAYTEAYARLVSAFARHARASVRKAEARREPSAQELLSEVEGRQKAEEEEEEDGDGAGMVYSITHGRRIPMPRREDHGAVYRRILRELATSSAGRERGAAQGMHATALQERLEAVAEGEGAGATARAATAGQQARDMRWLLASCEEAEGADAGLAAAWLGWAEEEEAAGAVAPPPPPERSPPFHEVRAALAPIASPEVLREAAARLLEGACDVVLVRSRVVSAAAILSAPPTAGRMPTVGDASLRAPPLAPPRHPYTAAAARTTPHAQALCGLAAWASLQLPPRALLERTVLEPDACVFASGREQLAFAVRTTSRLAACADAPATAATAAAAAIRLAAEAAARQEAAECAQREAGPGSGPRGSARLDAGAGLGLDAAFLLLMGPDQPCVRSSTPAYAAVRDLSREALGAVREGGGPSHLHFWLAYARAEEVMGRHADALKVLVGALGAALPEGGVAGTSQPTPATPAAAVGLATCRVLHRATTASGEPAWGAVAQAAACGLQVSGAEPPALKKRRLKAAIRAQEAGGADGSAPRVRHVLPLVALAATDGGAAARAMPATAVARARPRVAAALDGALAQLAGPPSAETEEGRAAAAADVHPACHAVACAAWFELAVSGPVSADAVWRRAVASCDAIARAAAMDDELLVRRGANGGGENEEEDASPAPPHATAVRACVAREWLRGAWVDMLCALAAAGSVSDARVMALLLDTVEAVPGCAWALALLPRFAAGRPSMFHARVALARTLRAAEDSPGARPIAATTWIAALRLECAHAALGAASERAVENVRGAQAVRVGEPVERDTEDLPLPALSIAATARVLRLCARAAASSHGSAFPLVWRIYARLALRTRGPAEADRVLVRGLARCPGCRALWLDRMILLGRITHPRAAVDAVVLASSKGMRWQATPPQQ